MLTTETNVVEQFWDLVFERNHVMFITGPNDVCYCFTSNHLN